MRNRNEWLLVVFTATTNIADAATRFLAGLGGTMWTVNARVIYQTLVPDDLLGRYTAASRLVGWGATPIAAAIAGVLASATNFRVAFGAFAVACAALVVPYLRIDASDALALEPETVAVR
jgi:hypothetical protein